MVREEDCPGENPWQSQNFSDSLFVRGLMVRWQYLWRLNRRLA